MKYRKAVFLDRDGTINVEKNYLYRLEDFEYIVGAIEALRILQGCGYMLVVITNQSGIARGYYTEQEFLKLNNWMLSDMENKGIHIERVYYCPHYPGGMVDKFSVECSCRKPKTGLFWQAQQELDIEMDKSFAIGDHLRDLYICSESDVQGILLGDNDKIPAPNTFKKILWYCDSLRQAAKYIEGIQSDK